MKRVFIFLLIAAIAAACYWQFYLRNKGRSAELVIYGNVDIREVNLGFRVSGKIKEVPKDEGDAVKTGEVVARLDDEPYKRQVEEAKGQVASLKAKLDLLKAGYRKEEIDQSRAAVEERKSALDNAALLFNRRKELLQQKVASKQEYDDAQSGYEQAGARLNSAKANLAQLEAGNRPEEIAQGEADLKRAEATLSTAQLNLSDTELKSPSDGVVMTRALEPGSIVQAGPTVLTVSLANPVWVRAYIHEPDLGKVFPGMKAEVFTDSRPEKPYEGQVGFISPRAEFTPKSVETAELRTGLVYRLRIIVNNIDSGLRQGMPATVRLIPK